MEIRGAARENKRFARNRVIGKPSSGKFPANFPNGLKFIASFFRLEDAGRKELEILGIHIYICIRGFIILNLLYLNLFKWKLRRMINCEQLGLEITIHSYVGNSLVSIDLRLVSRYIM